MVEKASDTKNAKSATPRGTCLSMNNIESFRSAGFNAESINWKKISFHDLCMFIIFHVNTKGLHFYFSSLPGDSQFVTVLWCAGCLVLGQKVLNASAPQFFDVVPAGRILNRFSKVGAGMWWVISWWLNQRSCLIELKECCNMDQMNEDVRHLIMWKIHEHLCLRTWLIT